MRTPESWLLKTHECGAPSFHVISLKNLQLPQRTLQDKCRVCLPLGLADLYFPCFGCLACTWSQRLVSAGIKILRPHKNKPCDLNAALAVAGSFSLHAFGLHQRSRPSLCPDRPSLARTVPTQLHPKGLKP